MDAYGEKKFGKHYAKVEEEWITQLRDAIQRHHKPGHRCGVDCTPPAGLSNE